MIIENLLSEGLAAGFGGDTNTQDVNRGGFELQSSHYISPEGGIYHDEWAADRAGGGQELADKDGQRFTRVYAGGTIAEDELAKIGITKGDIMGYLKERLTQDGDKIRLSTNFGAEHGDWSYSYKVTDKDDEIPMTTGTEIISYKGRKVFKHVFIMCPVE